MKKTGLYLLLFLVVFSCKKPDDDLPNEVVIDSIDSVNKLKGIFVLNEGTWQQNNASLSYLDVTENTVTENYFSQKTGRQLGDVGNDLLYVNNTLFILVNASNSIEKLNTKTGESKQLKIVNFQNVGRQPRQFFLATNGDLFITSFDDFVSIVDTASLTLKKIIRVGRDPEGLAVVGNKLFVANSGGLDFPNYESTVSVIDISSYTSIDTLHVGLNPGSMQLDNYGRLFVNCNGDYAKVKPSIHIVNTATHQTEAIWDYSSRGLQVVGDTIFTINSETLTVELFDTQTRSLIKSGLVDVSSFSAISSFKVDPKSKLIFIADGLDYVTRGKVYAYDYSGKEQFHFDAGVIPGGIAFDYE